MFQIIMEVPWQSCLKMKKQKDDRTNAIYCIINFKKVPNIELLEVQMSIKTASFIFKLSITLLDQLKSRKPWPPLDGRKSHQINQACNIDKASIETYLWKSG